jgi:hypothetical protein
MAPAGHITRAVLNETRLALSFRIFLLCNIVLAILFLFAFVESIIAVSGGADVRAHVEDLIGFPIYLLIVWGLKLKRSWVRPLICGTSCFFMLRMLIAMVLGDLLNIAANPVAVIFIFLFNGLFIVFYSYQLYFFSRKDLKAYCNNAGRNTDT